MANRGYIRDLLGVRTSPWSHTSASDAPEAIQELDESTQRFLMIAAVVGDTKGQDPEWPEVSAIAEAIHSFTGHASDITSDKVMIEFTDEVVNELQRNVEAVTATPETAPGPAGGARRPTRQAPGGSHT